MLTVLYIWALSYIATSKENISLQNLATNGVVEHTAVAKFRNERF